MAEFPGGRFRTYERVAGARRGGNGLADLSGTWIDRVGRRKPVEKLVIDLDFSVSQTHGHQEGTARNGHFECTCYHPLFCFNRHGDLERALLRKGNVHTAEEWRAVLEAAMERHREWHIEFFLGDAGFAFPEL